jgi:diguanylate cyclase (GGDEF)-like protein
MPRQPLEPARTQPAGIERTVAAAESDLARLGDEVAAMEALLMRLLQDVVVAERRLEFGKAAQLLKANERLVLASLRCQSEADTAQQALADASVTSRVDPLTGLHDRHTLRERFAQVSAQARRHDRPCALLFVDLNGFKRLNDNRGHAFGDRVLRAVAQRMVAAVREEDTVSRHGGDEFLILVPELAQVSDAHAVAEKIARTIAAPMDIDGQKVEITASIGLAVCPDDGEDLDSLIEHADAAMYEHKRRRPGDAAKLDEALVAPADLAPTATTPDAERLMTDLRDANEHLVLAALSAQELRAAAEQARERQARFIKAAAAELRNPQAPLRIATAMLGQAPDQAPLLSRVERAIEQRMAHIARLIDDLIDASGRESGALVLERRTVDLLATIDAAVSAQRQALERRALHLQWKRPPQAVLLDADPLRLQQIVANLIDNARAHTPGGGHIELTVEAREDVVTLSVSDDGVGISPQVLPRVFEPFAQALDTLDLDTPALGLGLSAVRTLVRAHGGEITAHSAGVNRGSRFVVTLPRQR